MGGKGIIVNKREELEGMIGGGEKLYCVIGDDVGCGMGCMKMVVKMVMVNVGVEKIGGEM